MKSNCITTCSSCGEEYDENEHNHCPKEVSPGNGGCWICRHVEGAMKFDVEFDTFYHESCLPDDMDSILGYERDG